MNVQSYENIKNINILQQFATCILLHSTNSNDNIHLLNKQINKKEFYRLLNDWVSIMNEYFIFGNEHVKDKIFNKIYPIYKTYVLKYIDGIHYCYNDYYKQLIMRVEYRKNIPFNKLQNFIYIPISIHNNSIVCYIFEKFCDDFPMIERNECYSCKTPRVTYRKISETEIETEIETETETETETDTELNSFNYENNYNYNYNNKY